MTITAVSSGVKKQLCEKNLITQELVRVINNAVDFPNVDDTDSSEVYKRYSIDPDKRIIISAGSLCERKNQIQLLRAFLLLPQHIKNDYIIFLAGEDRTNGEIIGFIKKNNLESHVVVSGFIPKEELAKVYQISDINVLLSKSEGFGLSMIEAASFGIPTATFNDLDVINDIYSDKSMVLLDNHDDSTVSDGLIRMISTKWDKNEIRQTVERFSSDIYLEYLSLYKEIIDKHDNTIPEGSISQYSGIGIK